MKKIFFLFFLLITVSLFSQILELTSQQKIYVVQLTPSETGFVTKVQGRWRLYNSQMEQILSFTLDVPENVYIYGCAQDFDDDENYEIFYWYYDEEYRLSTVLKDLATGENQLDMIGDEQYSYMPYSAPFYVDNQRYYSITKVFSGNYQVVETYLYRSGVQVQNLQNDAIDNTNNSISNLYRYPNPFFQNGKQPVKIEFSISKTQQTSLEIYNIKGQKVDTIFKDRLLKKGNHSFIWYPKSHLASGIYFCNVRTENGQSSKKLILIK